jgi:HEAT repeat protein
VRQLGRFKRDDAADEIIKIYKSDRESRCETFSVERHSLIRRPASTTAAAGYRTNDTNSELRRSAIRVLGERGESAIDDLIKLYDNEQSTDVRKTTLSSLAEIKNNRVEDKLFEVAKVDAVNGFTPQCNSTIR